MEPDLAILFSTPLTALITSVIILIYLLLVAAEWKILTKAGEKGWKSLIPVYNVFISHHIIGMRHIWFILEIVTWTVELVFELVEKVPEWVDIAFGIPTGAITLIAGLIHINKLCNCFGKGTGFKIGMVFFPNVFTMIIAFGKAEYKKPQHG